MKKLLIAVTVFVLTSCDQDEFNRPKYLVKSIGSDETGFLIRDIIYNEFDLPISFLDLHDYTNTITYNDLQQPILHVKIFENSQTSTRIDWVNDIPISSITFYSSGTTLYSSYFHNNNFVYKIDSLQHENGDKYLFSKVAMEFDHNDLLIKEAFEITNGNNVVLSYEYDDKANPFFEKFIFLKDVKFIFINELKLFTSSNNVTGIESTNNNLSEYEYKYNKDGYPVSVKWNNWPVRQINYY